MSAGKPLWRRGFDRAERGVGRPLEELVGTRGFSNLLAETARAQRAAVGLFERQTRAVLHFWNMPARSDVSGLRRQVGALTAEVRELNAKLDDEQRTQSSRAARQPTRGGAAKRTGAGS